MKILGIETSCDETSAAVVENGQKIFSNIVVSSLKEHTRYGGVIPEIASRRQLECIQPVVKQALDEAKISLDKIDAIAVTESPGLIGSLLVGISFAKTLSFTCNKQYLGIDHVKAHLYANFITRSPEQFSRPALPAVGLVVSGGHTNLYLVKSFKNIKLLGQTRDDAAGEAFDKVARICGLAYPGGPEIDRLARGEKKSDLQFTCAQLPDTLDFSFSGIKTAVLYRMKDSKITPRLTKKVAFAFQESVVSVLVKKCLEAAKRHKVKTILVGGGVAANSFLRKKLTQTAQGENMRVHLPPMELCLDNAAMIAGLAYHERSRGGRLTHNCR